MKQNQRGFIIPLVIIIAVLVIIIGVFYYKSTRSPKQENVVARNSQTYVNSEYGFSVQFPQSWSEYKVLTGEWRHPETQELIANTVSFSLPQCNGRILQISIHPISKWSDEEGVGPNLISKNNKYAFAYTDGFDVACQGEFYKDIPSIISTFKVISN